MILSVYDKNLLSRIRRTHSSGCVLFIMRSIGCVLFIMRSIDRKFYESTEWRACQSAYMKQANHLCERCLSKGIYEPAKIVHHKVHLTEETIGNAELMYGFDNLEALCLSCHNEEHFGKKKERRWEFVEGELITKENSNA